MKRTLIFLCICLFVMSSINAEYTKDFIEVDKNVDVDEQVYNFFYDYFSKYSRNLLKNNRRKILDDKTNRLDFNNYYDRQGYFDFLCSDDDFYVIDKIIINSKKQEPETFDLYLKLGIISEEYYDITFNIKSRYDKYGNIYKDTKEFTDKIGVFRYANKCSLSQLCFSSTYNWVLEEDEETLIQKIKKDEIYTENYEDVNHFITKPTN